MGQLRGGGYLRAVKAEDNIPRLQARIVGGAALGHLHHQRSPGPVQAEGFGQVLVHVLDGHTQPAAGHPAIGLQLLDHVAHHPHRDGKGQADGATAAGEYLRIDAHHLAIQIEQRAAGITRVDRHIGLDEGHVVFVALSRQAAAHGADDARRHGIIQPKGRADGQHPLAHLQFAVFSQFEDREVFGVNAQQRQVRARVGTDHFGVELATVTHPDQHAIGAVHHMVVGDNVPVRRNDKARSHAHLFVLRRRGAAELEESAQVFGDLIGPRLAGSAPAGTVLHDDFHHCR